MLCLMQSKSCVLGCCLLLCGLSHTAGLPCLGLLFAPFLAVSGGRTPMSCPVSCSCAAVTGLVCSLGSCRWTPVSWMVLCSLVLGPLCFSGTLRVAASELGRVLRCESFNAASCRGIGTAGSPQAWRFRVFRLPCCT